MSKKRIRKDLIAICLLVVLFGFGLAVFIYIDPWAYGAELPRSGIGFPTVIVAILSVFVIRQALWAKWVLGIWLVGAGLFATIMEFGVLGRSIINNLALDPGPHRSRFFLMGGIILGMGLYYLFAGIYILVTVKKQRVDEENR